MTNRMTAIGWIASLMLMVQGPLLALGGGVGDGGFHGGSIGNARHVTNPIYYPGGYWTYGMGPTTVEGDEDLNARGSGSGAPVAGTGTGGGPPEPLQDGRGVYAPQGVANPEGADWASDWWAQDPRSEAEKARAAAVAEASVGTVIPSLPRSYDIFTLYVANTRYYYGEGTFYQAVEGGYQIMAPPIGAEVPQIPRDAEMVKVNGQQYFVYHDIYYQAVYAGSGVVYKVVEVPSS